MDDLLEVFLLATTIASVLICCSSAGRIKELKNQLQEDKAVILSLYEQIATTEMACDIEIEKAQVACVD